jgi:hypothetical protein
MVTERIGSTVKLSRIVDSDDTSSRCNLIASVFRDMREPEKQHYIDTFAEEQEGRTTKVHLSGKNLRSVLTEEQIIALVKSIGRLKSVTEFFCFHGGLKTLTSDLIAESLPPNLKVLMLWHFRTLSNDFVAALRQHISLSRVTLNFPCTRKNQMAWGCLDLCVMALSCMEHLETLQIRCVLPDGAIYTRQEECIISPEAFVLLVNSSSIQNLFLENCGLLDDHIDFLYDELPSNKVIRSLNFRDNLFSDDCLYSLGRFLPVAPAQLQAIDVSGVAITNAAGKALAAGMAQNDTLQSLQLEDTWTAGELSEDDYDSDDEIERKQCFANEPWMTEINDQIRFNRANGQNTGSSRLILANAYKPPRELVLTYENMKKRPSILEVKSFEEAVYVVSENVSIALKDVPSKATYVISTISDNVNIAYQYTSESLQKRSGGAPQAPSGGSPFSCSLE